MTALIAGVDFSSEQIDVAIIPLDPDHGDPDLAAVTTRLEQIPASHGHTDLRPVHAAYLMQRLLMPVAGYDVTQVWIEEPFTRSMTTAKVLGGIFGAIKAGSWLPRGRRHVESVPVTLWRSELGIKQRGEPGEVKRASVTKVAELYRPELALALSHHACEALLIAHVARELMLKGEAA